MGAKSFAVTAPGATLTKAFWQAVTDAQFDHGHAGDTGTIAEKSAVREVRPPAGVSGEEAIREWAYGVLDDEITDPALAWINSKWAPAAAVMLDRKTWFLFGWASS